MAALPVGLTRNQLAVVGLVTVTFMTTAVALAGTAPAPATFSARVAPGPHGVEKPPVPSRESRTRFGVTAVKRSPRPAR